MALSAEELSAQIDALTRMIGSGTLRSDYEFGGARRSLEFRSTSQLVQAKRHLEEELAAVTGGSSGFEVARARLTPR